MPPGGYLSTSADIFHYHDCDESAAGTECVEARGATEPPTIYATALHRNELRSPKR